MKAILFIKLEDGVELAVGFVTRVRSSAYTHEERETSVSEAIAGMRALPPLLSGRVSLSSHLESEVPE